MLLTNAPSDLELWQDSLLKHRSEKYIFESDISNFSLEPKFLKLDNWYYFDWKYIDLKLWMQVEWWIWKYAFAPVLMSSKETIYSYILEETHTHMEPTPITFIPSKVQRYSLCLYHFRLLLSSVESLLKARLAANDFLLLIINNYQHIIIIDNILLINISYVCIIFKR